MKKTLITTVLATIAIVQTASAIAVTGFLPNEDGSPGDVTFEGYANGPKNAFAVPLPGGATLAYNDAVIVQNFTDPNGAIPFPTGNGDYLSIKANGSATFAFTTAQSIFAFQWGSIDSYNTIAFYLGGNLQNSFTGTQVVQSPVNANGEQGLNGSAFVTFGDGTFDKVVLTSSVNSFELDNVSIRDAGTHTSVPDSGSTLALTGLALFGFGLIRRQTA